MRAHWLLDGFAGSLVYQYQLASLTYVDLVLKALEIVYPSNGAAVEGLADKNAHRKKEVGKGKNTSWGGA